MWLVSLAAAVLAATAAYGSSLRASDAFTINYRNQTVFTVLPENGTCMCQSFQARDVIKARNLVTPSGNFTALLDAIGALERTVQALTAAVLNQTITNSRQATLNEQLANGLAGCQARQSQLNATVAAITDVVRVGHRQAAIIGDLSIEGSILNAWQLYRAQIPAWESSVVMNNRIQNVTGCTVTIQCTKDCLLLMEASGHTSTMTEGRSCWLYVSFAVDDRLPIPGNLTWPVNAMIVLDNSDRHYGMHLASGNISGANNWQSMSVHQQMNVGPGVHTVWLRALPQRTDPCPLNSRYHLNGVAMAVSVLDV